MGEGAQGLLLLLTPVQEGACSQAAAPTTQPTRGPPRRSGCVCCFGSVVKDVCKSRSVSVPNSPTSLTPTQAGGASLEARERDLAEREAKLKKLEEEIRAAGGFRKNNWPVCFPIWYHDIAGDIPDDSKRIVREVYMSWWVSTTGGGSCAWESQARNAREAVSVSGCARRRSVGAAAG